MSETKYEVYNVLDNPPKDGEVVQTAEGLRTFCACYQNWDDVEGDDYVNDLCESYYYSYDTRAQRECKKAHNAFIQKYRNLKDKKDWDDWNGCEPYDYK